MSHLDLTGCKKRKRGERVFRFKSFGEHGYPVEFVGAFRENVKALLEFGHLESNLWSGMPCWSFQLEVHRHPPLHVLLFVVEEPIDVSINRRCKQCQYVGWGHHMICNKKYHFLLPSKNSMVAACLNCKTGSDQVVADSRNYGNSNILVQSQGHVMHGVLHSNGFGHLLCVNGLETGSDLTGHHIIEFWDRLCTGLRVRKVSLNDISQKRGMELRLIHGVGYGEPWFGRWGYRFGRGSFCVTQHMYQRAVEALQGMPLTLLIHHLCPTNKDLPVIFSRYQTLSDHSLTTLGDLFHFMWELKSRLVIPNDTTSKSNSINKDHQTMSYNPGILLETTCRWSPKRVEMATRVIVEALKRAHLKWVSRQQVRDAARNYIGDTGLLDFVLKSLGNQIVGDYLVRRSLNPVTKVLEYCLEDVSNVFSHEGFVANSSSSSNISRSSRYKITRFQLMKDMFYLYKYVLKDDHKLNSSGILSAVPVAVRIVLDSKYFVKEYYSTEIIPMPKPQMGLEGNSKLNLYCTVLLGESSSDHSNNNNFTISNNKVILPPYECVTVKHNATIDELKEQVEKSFRDIYWSLRSFVVNSIHNLSLKGNNSVFGMISQVGQKLVFEGTLSNNNSKEVDQNINREVIKLNNNTNNINVNNNHSLLYGSCGNWSENIYNSDSSVMDCPCGAKDDDGERRVSCDICETWQHTRCVGIPNSEEVPRIFLCSRCEQEIVLFPNSLP